MLIAEGADPFIKFALGENVKQSNWGDPPDGPLSADANGCGAGVLRPLSTGPASTVKVGMPIELQSRTRLVGSCARAKAPKVPRRDLELETLLQILESERFVTCHSYRQDEINMLMHVADSMGFTLNTFTHILEGYKVADKMAEHGAGGLELSAIGGPTSLR